MKAVDEFVAGVVDEVTAHKGPVYQVRPLDARLSVSET